MDNAMSKHTPGPWAVYHDGNYPYIIAEQGRRWNNPTVCALYDDVTPESSVTIGPWLTAYPNAEANARLIAGPNCTLTGAAVAAAPLLKTAGLKALRIASYQSVSGAGKAALEELDDHKKGMSEVARNARQASRFLDEIVSSGAGDIESGFSLKAKTHGEATGRLFLQTHSVGAQIPDSVAGGKRFSTMTGNQTARPVLGEITKFARHGKSGAWVADFLPNIASIADDYPFVEDVQYGREWVDKLFALRRIAGVTTAVLGVASTGLAAVGPRPSAPSTRSVIEGRGVTTTCPIVTGLAARDIIGPPVPVPS